MTPMETFRAQGNHPSGDSEWIAAWELVSPHQAAIVDLREMIEHHIRLATIEDLPELLADPASRNRWETLWSRRRDGSDSRPPTSM
jgi:hypothetical protein